MILLSITILVLIGSLPKHAGPEAKFSNPTLD